MLFLTDNSSRQANQNKLLLDTVKYSSLCCFTRCCGIIDLGSLTQVPRDLFLPFGGFLSTFCLQDNSEVVGLRKQSKTDFTFADASEISELGVKGAGKSTSPLSLVTLSETILKSSSLSSSSSSTKSSSDSSPTILATSSSSPLPLN